MWGKGEPELGALTGLGVPAPLPGTVLTMLPARARRSWAAAVSLESVFCFGFWREAG